jgi:hypothetical protein
MTKLRKQAWKLDPAEVLCSGSGGSVSNQRLIRQSRELRNTHASLVLEHGPTGVAVNGHIPPGRYSRKTMRELKTALHAQLFAQLEILVAKKLRIPGR